MELDFVVLNIHGTDLEVQRHSNGFWGDDKVILYSDPGECTARILQYLYNEGFIQDRRTPYIILEVT